MSGLTVLDEDPAFEGHSSDDDDLVEHHAALRAVPDLTFFDKSFRPPPDDAEQDHGPHVGPDDSPTRSRSVARPSDDIVHHSAADAVGMTTYAPKTYHLGVVDMAGNASGAFDDSAVAAEDAGDLEGKELPSMVDRFDETAADDPINELSALERDPKFASPEVSPRRAPSRERRSSPTLQPLPKPGRALVDRPAAQLAVNGGKEPASVPKPDRTRRGSAKTMTLKEQEERVEDLTKKNFNLRLEVKILRERLEATLPEAQNELLRKLAALEKEHEVARKQLDKHKRMLLTMNNLVEDLRNENEQLKKNFAAKGSYEDLEDELQQLREESLRDRTDLERRLRERERELRNLRQHGRQTWDSEPQAEIARLRDELDAERERRDRALAERDKMQALLSGGQDGSRGGDRSLGALQDNDNAPRDVQVLKKECKRLKVQVSEQAEQISRHGLEKQALRYRLDELQDQLTGKIRSANGNRSSQTSSLDIHAETDAYRDKLAVLELELHEKEQEINDLVVEGDNRDRLIDQKLQEQHQAMQYHSDRHDQYKEAFQNQQVEIEQLQAEMQDRNEELDNLGEDMRRVYEELDQTRAELDLSRQELHDCNSRNEQIIAALKEDKSHVKSRFEQALADRDQHQTKATTLAVRINELEAHLRSSEEDRDRLTREIRQVEEDRDRAAERHRRDRRDAERQLQRELDDKSKALADVQQNLMRAKERTKSLEADLSKLQQAFSDSQRLGESQSSTRVAIELERERLKSDLTAALADIEQLRSDLQRYEESYREADLRASTLKSDNRDLTGQVATQTAARLALSDKLDDVNKRLRSAQAEAEAAKDRLKSVESDLRKETRTTNRAQTSHRDELSERESLLSAIWQQLDRILGEKKSVAEAKPQTNFPAFHDRMLQRLRLFGTIQSTCEKRVRDIENKFQEHFNNLRRQQETSLKRLDRYDEKVRLAISQQQPWKQRVFVKQSELESLKNTNSALQEQLSLVRGQIPAGDGEPGSVAKLRQVEARASAAERREIQLKDHIAKLQSARETDQLMWDEHAKKYKETLRALQARLYAESAPKRDQHDKEERKRDLEGHISYLVKQNDGAHRRDNRLGDIVAKVRPSSAFS